MRKFYIMMTVIGLGAAGLFGYHWYDTESSIQTIHMHEEINGSSDKTNTSAGPSSFSSQNSGEGRFFGINERSIMAQKQQKND